MSEIKGQLLGMLLVLIAFAAVGKTMYDALNSTASNITQKVSTEGNVTAKAIVEIGSFFDR
ncbi:MAG: hypothetical protein Q4F15_06000 [Bacillota bacterium]|nr:hypothetical protein [Bacillota bacterium]